MVAIDLRPPFLRGPRSCSHCRVQILQIAELAVGVAGNRPVMDGQINDQPIKILVDTGAASPLGHSVDSGSIPDPTASADSH